MVSFYIILFIIALPFASILVILSKPAWDYFWVTRPIALPFWRAFKSRGKLKFVQVNDGTGATFFSVGHPTPEGIKVEPISKEHKTLPVEVDDEDVSVVNRVPIVNVFAPMGKALNPLFSAWASQKTENKELLPDMVDKIPTNIDLYLYNCQTIHNTPKTNQSLQIEENEFICNNTWEATPEQLKNGEESFFAKHLSGKPDKDGTKYPVPKCPICKGLDTKAEHITQPFLFDFKTPTTISMQKVRTIIDKVDNPLLTDLIEDDAYRTGQKDALKGLSKETFKNIGAIVTIIVAFGILYMIITQNSVCNRILTTSVQTAQQVAPNPLKLG